MPIMDGCESTKIIKEKMADNIISNCPIIGVSAFSGENEVKQCRCCGMSEIINKPITIKKLKEILRKYQIIS